MNFKQDKRRLSDLKEEENQSSIPQSSFDDYQEGQPDNYDDEGEDGGN